MVGPYIGSSSKLLKEGTHKNTTIRLARANSPSAGNTRVRESKTAVDITHLISTLQEGNPWQKKMKKGTNEKR